jgi:Fanconi-associated nuclease 1
MPTFPQRQQSESKPSPVTAPDDLQAKAKERERIERARAEALIASRSAASRGFKIEETPTPRRDEYQDQFNRDDVRAARGYRSKIEHAERDFQERPVQVDPGGLEESRRIDGSEKDIKREVGTESGTNTMEETTAERDSLKIEGTTAIRPATITPLQPLDPNVETKRSDSSSSMESTSSTDSNRPPRESMYPAIFGEMISTVLDTESYLFTRQEQTLLRSFHEMDYEARHLFARLIQRRNTWHRLDKLQYDFDVKDKVLAVSNLCKPVMCDAIDSEGKEAGAEVDEEDNDGPPCKFCESEQDMNGGEEEALGLLSLDELKLVAKKMNRLKGSNTVTKATLITSLLTTKSQGTLHGFAAAALKSPSDQTKLGFPVKSQSDVLHQTLKEIIGGCVRVSPQVQKLVNRIALVYYRGAELGGSALTTAVLSRSRKRSYPAYTWQRSPALFASRKHLLAMERALRIEVQMDELIEWDGGKEALAKAMKLFESIYEEWREAVKEGETFAEGDQPIIDRLTYHRMRFHPGWPLTRIVYKGVSVLARFHQHKREAEVLNSLLAQRVFRRGRRGDWYDRLALITAQYPDSTNAAVVRKAKREALNISIQGIQDPDTHLIYHDTLQRRITRLESQLKLPFAEKHDFSYAKLKRCEDKIFTGVRLDRMLDPKSGLFGSSYVHTEKSRSRPKTGRNASDSSSNSESTNETSGFRFHKPLHKVVKVERRKAEKMVKTESEEPIEEKVDPEQQQGESRQVRRDMHSVWRGLDSKPCRVEMLVLQHYELEGYKGYHCEGGILTMLFALLMWDILYTPLPGVFETPYQRQPLDLTEDSFAIVRGPMIRQRLSDIEEKGGLDFIKETDERERDKKTWAVGCRWSLYPREDLLEIAECMGGKALALICQMLSEEWEKISAGLPDLCVWRYEDKKVRFCEVKGPGDRLSEKQKLWIDILLRAGLDVEVSLVQEGKEIISKK